MEIETVLNDTKNSFLIFTSGETTDVVIAVPHHAPLGVTELPCKEHPEADENAGFLGYYLSRLLNCHSIIACNYFLDPNKDKESDYCKKILSLKPKILVEIHGHSGRSAKFDIEISSGNLERDFWSKEMAERLRTILSDSHPLQNYSLSGDFNKIFFKATNSFTITTNEWVAFHIELPKTIRESKNEYELFCKSLAETIKGLLVDSEKILKSNAKPENNGASDGESKLVDKLFSGLAVAVDDEELDIIFSKSTEELADEIIQFAKEQKLVEEDGGHLRQEIEDLFWANKGVNISGKASHFKYQTAMKKAWLIASAKVDDASKSGRYYQRFSNDEKTIASLSNDILADQILSFAKETNLGDDAQDALNWETLNLFWKSKGIRNQSDTSLEIELKIKQVEKLAREKLFARVFSATNDELSQELAAFAKKKAGRENDQRVRAQFVAYTFWRSKGIGDRITDSVEMEQRKEEIEILAQEILDNEFRNRQSQRLEMEMIELPGLIKSCVEWARNSNRNNITIKDVKFYLLEKHIDILDATERALYIGANNELRFKKKAI